MEGNVKGLGSRIIASDILRRLGTAVAADGIHSSDFKGTVKLFVSIPFGSWEFPYPGKMLKRKAQQGHVAAAIFLLPDFAAPF